MSSKTDGLERALPRSEAHPLLQLRRTFAEEIRRRRGLIAGAVIGMLLSTGAALLAPWPIAWTLDYILAGKPLPPGLAFLEAWAQGEPVALLLPASLAVVAIAALDAGAGYLHRYFLDAASQTVVSDMRARLFSQLQSQSLSFRDTWRSGDVVVRMTRDAQELKDVLVDLPLKWLAWGTQVVAISAVLVWQDWRLAALAWLVAPVLFFLTLRFGTGVNEASRRKKKNESRVASLLSESLAALPLVKAYGREQDERERFRVHNTAAQRAEIRALQLSKSFKRLADVLIAAGTAIVLYQASSFVLDGALSVGILVVFYRYLKDLYRPVEKFALSIVDAAKLSTSCERILELTDDDLVIETASDAVPARALAGRIEFRDVSFGYRDGPLVLERLSFSVAPGETLALVGRSGAGKSTLIRLLLRFYDPRAGGISIDGTDLRRFELASLRGQIAVLFQEPMLFRRSIAENIAFGQASRTRAEIESAARLARAHEFIEFLPEGYDTALSDAGANLSGGQQQRIAIARTILRDSPIVILDEPYKGLDAQNEAAVLEALENLVRSRTALVIAHRFDTLRRADRVLLLEPGRPAEIGRHAELLARSEHYRDLVELQQRGQLLFAEPALAAAGS